MKGKEGQRPVLIGSVSRCGKFIRVWCPYCRKHHVHGAGQDEHEGRMTHRIAHCFRNDSPFHANGYFVLDPDAKRRVKESAQKVSPHHGVEENEF